MNVMVAEDLGESVFAPTHWTTFAELRADFFAIVVLGGPRRGRNEPIRAVPIASRARHFLISEAAAFLFLVAEAARVSGARRFVLDTILGLAGDRVASLQHGLGSKLGDAVEGGAVIQPFLGILCESFHRQGRKVRVELKFNIPLHALESVQCHDRFHGACSVRGGRRAESERQPGSSREGGTAVDCNVGRWVASHLQRGQMHVPR